LLNRSEAARTMDVDDENTKRVLPIRCDLNESDHSDGDRSGNISRSLYTSQIISLSAVGLKLDWTKGEDGIGRYILNHK
jgi:hypothetical protein